MTSPWHRWDEQVRDTGKPARVAEQLTDEELLALLDAPESHESDRDHERLIVKQEILDRLKGRHG